ncbi:type II secretion system secretin GspD [Microvirga terricola]|nr:type II secretion system secretin GspD [Microvirga terricola]
MLIVLVTCGCTASSGSKGVNDNRTSVLGGTAAYLTSGRPERGTSDALASDQTDRRRGFTDIGTQPATPSEHAAADQVQVSDDGAKVTLNFVNVEIQSFVRVVFDEILRENVVVDPELTGRVTVRTTDPVSRGMAVNLVRNVLQLNGGALTKNGGMFRVSARGSGNNRGQFGENIRVVPVRYLNPDQARAALQPFSNSGTEITASNEGRYLIISGAPADLDSLAQVLQSLDIDQMRGMSFALIPLKDANATSVATELGQMFGQGSSPSLKALPIQRMNAVLLMTSAPQTLERAKTWISQLDLAGSDTRQVRVFPVQNRRATDVAQMLNGILGAKGDRPAKPDNAPTAPSLTPGAAQTDSAVARLQQANITSASAQPNPESETASGGIQGIQVRADSSTNSLVVMAQPEHYRLIEATIRRLDVLPTQVLVEATIAEVSLNDALRYGVRWYFQKGNHAISLNDAGAKPGSQLLAGFNYVFSVPNGELVVNALEQVTNLEVISSPALTVLDNETATLKVGDQVPIATRSARTVTTPDAPIVNDIEMKDTGIILSVTPRVNSSGLVMLDISQEVSDVVPTASSSIDSPTIRQRKINSSVAVQSGSEIILGGLISSNRQQGSQGIPLLKDIPLLGAAFTNNAAQEQRRTELLIIIRPTVIANRMDVTRVTEEIKAGMAGISKALAR